MKRLAGSISLLCVCAFPLHGEWIIQTEPSGVSLEVSPLAVLPAGEESVLHLESGVFPLPDDPGMAAFDVPMMPAADFPVADRDGDLIEMMARSLTDSESDPVAKLVRIWQFMHDRMLVEPYAGLIRSPERALLDGQGGVNELAHLFSELLRRIGFSTCFTSISGQSIPLQSDAELDLRDLSGVADAHQAFRLFRMGGMIASPPPEPLQPDDRVNLYLPAVGVQIGSQWVYFTPWHRKNTMDQFVDFRSALGYDRSVLLEAAGGTTGPNWAKGLDAGAVKQKLDQFSRTLQQSMQAESLSIDSVLPFSRPDVDRDRNASYFGPVATKVGVDHVHQIFTPAFYATLTLSGGNLSPLTLNTWEIAHRKLSVRFETDGAYRARIYLDEELLQTESSGGAAESAFDLSLTFSHGLLPGGANTAVYPLKRGSQYVICQGFGTGTSGSMSSYVNKQLAALGQREEQEGCLERLTESLRYTGQRWIDQMATTVQVARLFPGLPNFLFYQYGIMAAEPQGFYIDIKQQHTFGVLPDGAFAFSNMMLGSALEHAVLEQLQPENAKGTSTIRVLTRANETGMPIYRTDDSTWNAVKPLLNGHDTSALESVINQGGICILPKTNSVTIEAWSGGGHVEYTRGQSLSMKVGLYKGAVNALRTAYSPSIQTRVTIPVHAPKNNNIIPALSWDPVDLKTGAFVFDGSADLELGGPLPLILQRSYRSDSSSDWGMGPGWNHSFNIRAIEHSAIDESFGERSAEDLVPLLVGLTAIQDLMDNESSARDWIAAAIAADWTADQLTQNAVSIFLGSQALTFVRQPDGSYTPPPGMTHSLTNAGGVYVMQQRHRNTFTFDTNLNIETISDPSGNTLSFSYNAQTNLQDVATSFGSSLSFFYTGDRLTSVSDNTGRTVHYQYDEKNNCTRFDDAAGASWLVDYDDERHPHAITALHDPEGITTIQNIYNGWGQVSSQISPSGWTYQQVASNWSGAETNPLGQRILYQYDRCGRITAVIRADLSRNHTLYDGWGRIVQTINENSVTNTFAYDIHHNLLELREAVGTPEERASLYAYDSLHRLVSVSNQVSATEWKGSSLEYDDAHRITKTIDALGNETIFTYDTGNGLPHTVVHPDGSIVTYIYDALGNPARMTSTDAGTVEFTYTPRGELVQQIDGRGAVTRFFYDPLGQQTGVLFADGSTVSNVYWDNRLLQSSTDALGNTTHYTWTPAYKEKTITFPDGSIVSNIYDAADRLVATKNPEHETTTFELDAVGRIIRLVSPGSMTAYEYDAVGNPVLSVDDPSGLHLWAETVYDALNRPIARSTALTGEQVRYDAQGRVIRRIDPASRHWRYEVDLLGRRTAQIRPSGATEQFAYDVPGNRTGFTNAEGHSMGFSFDAQGRVTAITNAIGHVISFSYDVNGNLVGRTDAGGATTDYQYDPLNRLVRVDSGDAWAEFSHDANGNILSHREDGGTVVSFAYDSMNRLSSSTQLCASVSSSVENQYDLNGNRTAIAYPGGLDVAYIYDAGDRLSGAVLTGSMLSTPFPFSFAYDGASRMTSIDYPNGITSTFTYDAENRISSYSHGGYVERSIQRDPRGFKTREDIYAGFIPAIRLGASQSRTHNAADQLQSDGETTYTYDPNGNLVAAGDRMYEWDFDNRLATVQSTGGVVRYGYDAGGSRVTRTHITDYSVAETYFVVDYADPLRRILCEVASDGTIARWYVWAGFRLLAHIDADGTVRYYHSDELGNTIAMSDPSGQLSDEFAYAAYGELLGRTGVTQTPFLWMGGCGLYSDPVAGLHLTRFRAYCVQQRRFLSTDPLGTDASVNLYMYGAMNPLHWIDPLGLDVYAVDGTWFDAKNSGRYSNVHDFYVRAKQADELARYYAGPGAQSRGIVKLWQGITGAGSRSIADRVYTNIKSDLASGTGDGVVNLVGFSRGGMIVMDVAQRLARDGISVNFVGLYDAVKMSPSRRYPTSVPGNVLNFAHATKTAPVRVTQPYPTTRFGHSNERAFNLNSGGASRHGAIGASTQTGAHHWMLNQATAAGVGISPGTASHWGGATSFGRISK